MVIKTENHPNDLAKQILEQENQDRQALALLLDRHLARNDQILVQKTHMGTTEAFIGSVTLEWLAIRVRYASQLPLFQQKFDQQTNNIVRDADTIEALQQRPLDWSRQAALAQYLAARKTHKFPPVLVVLSSGWVDNAQAAQWDKNQRARQSAAEFTSLDKDRTVGLLDVSDHVSIFALDGQHRLMGIQALMELIKIGTLQKYSKGKKPIGSLITVDDLIEEYHISPGYLQSLATEKIGIEFIPAVVQGETREEARRRIRSIFAHVNLMAVRLSKGQLALLNEDDGFSIVARKIAMTHPLLREMENRNPRVNWDSATVSAKSTVLTTLQALKHISELYLGYQFPHWKPCEKGLIPMRPEDEELEMGTKTLTELFDYLASLPSYQKLDHGKETPQLRRFNHERGGGEGNMLFRPVGQIALVQALAILVFNKDFSLKTIFEKLQKYDGSGGFSQIDHPQSPWYGILYDPNRKRVLVSGRELASKVMLYLLGGVTERMERAQLRIAVANARSVGKDQGISFEGKFVKLKEVGLPPQL